MGINRDALLCWLMMGCFESFVAAFEGTISP